MRIAFRGPHSWLGLWVAAVALAADQLHKWWMLYIVEIAERRIITLTSFFDVVLVWNRGVSYGWFQQDSDLGIYLLVGFTALAVLAMIIWLAACDGRFVAVGLGLIIGGALGNGTDRLVHGAVADFFSFHAFGYYLYIFNLADVAIVAGVAILLYDSVLDRWRAKRVGDSHG
jgi:signal peptidase II